MNNGLEQPQTVLLLGGTSEIGLAIVQRLSSPVLRSVVLACRDTTAGEAAADSIRGSMSHVSVQVVSFDGADHGSHQQVIDDVAARVGDIDVTVLAFGQLGDNAVTSHDSIAASALMSVNVVGGVSASIAVANMMRRQGHGGLVVLSSVAGERVRPGNLVYGATKAGLDAFAQGLGDQLVKEKLHVLIVRPGFVHSKMTAGLKAAPFATTPDAVAQRTVAALQNHRRIVWAPGILRYVFSVLRHLPAVIWRRLPLD